MSKHLAVSLRSGQCHRRSFGCSMSCAFRSDDKITIVYSTYISAFILREATARMASAAVANLARR